MVFGLGKKKKPTDEEAPPQKGVGERIFSGDLFKGESSTDEDFMGTLDTLLTQMDSESKRRLQEKKTEIEEIKNYLRRALEERKRMQKAGLRMRFFYEQNEKNIRNNTLRVRALIKDYEDTLDVLKRTGGGN